MHSEQNEDDHLFRSIFNSIALSEWISDDPNLFTVYLDRLPTETLADRVIKYEIAGGILQDAAIIPLLGQTRLSSGIDHLQDSVGREQADEMFSHFGRAMPLRAYGYSQIARILAHPPVQESLGVDSAIEKSFTLVSAVMDDPFDATRALALQAILWSVADADVDSAYAIQTMGASLPVITRDPLVENRRYFYNEVAQFMKDEFFVAQLSPENAVNFMTSLTASAKQEHDPDLKQDLQAHLDTINGNPNMQNNYMTVAINEIVIKHDVTPEASKLRPGQMPKF